MTDKIFVDSSVWLYLFLKDKIDKYHIAEEFIAKNDENTLTISYQVINEVTNQLVRGKFSEQMIKENLGFMFRVCTIHNFSKDTILLASTVRERHSFSFWDSIIVASALNSGCTILASEDMQDGIKLGNMTIQNIFK